LYGLGVQDNDEGTTGLPYRPGIITAIRRGMLQPPRTRQLRQREQLIEAECDFSGNIGE